MHFSGISYREEIDASKYRRVLKYRDQEDYQLFVETLRLGRGEHMQRGIRGLRVSTDISSRWLNVA